MNRVSHFCAKNRHLMLLIAYIVAISVMLIGMIYIFVAAGHGHPNFDEINDFIRTEEDQLLQKELGTKGSYIFVSGFGLLTMIRQFQSFTGKWYRGVVETKLFEVYDEKDYNHKDEYAMKLKNKLKKREDNLYWLSLSTFLFCAFFVYFTAAAMMLENEGRCYYMPNYKSAAVLMGSVLLGALLIWLDFAVSGTWKWARELEPVCETPEHSSTDEEKREEPVPSRGMHSDVLVLDEAPELSEIQPPSEESSLTQPVLTSLLSQANLPPAPQPVVASESTTKRDSGIVGNLKYAFKHPLDAAKDLYNSIDVKPGQENKCWSKCF